MPPRHTHHRPRPFRVVYQDDHLLVADKAPGILTVPIPGKKSRNLQELLDRYLVSHKQTVRPVHRIDRYTSGLVLFAKNHRTWERLVVQFRAHTPERVYTALVRGHVKPAEGTLRHNLELTRDGFRQRVVTEEGTPATTHYRVVRHLPGVTLLEVRLDTGLKNQIRVQFRAAGYPLVGDRHYSYAERAETRLDRQALHARRLGFVHPATDRGMSFESPLPQDMTAVIRRLERGRG